MILSLLKKFTSKKYSAIISLIVLLITVALVYKISGKNLEIEPIIAEQKVLYTSSKAEEHNILKSFTATCYADHKYIIHSPVNGKIQNLLVSKGDLVKQNQTLIMIEPDNYAVILEGQQEEISNLQEQKNSLSPSSGTYGQIAEKLKQAEARYKSSAAYSQISKVRAPKNGRIEDILIDPSEKVSAGTDLLLLVGGEKTILKFFVNEKDIDKLTILDNAHIKFKNGKDAQGFISFISHSADQASLLFAVEVTSNKEAPDGMTGNIILSLGEISAHSIPQSSILTQDDGKIGVMTYDNTSRTVSFVAVQIVDHEGDRFYVTNLPEDVNIIIHGQGYLVNGAKVNAKEQSKLLGGANEATN